MAVLNPVTLNVPPVIFLNVAVPAISSTCNKYINTTTSTKSSYVKCTASIISKYRVPLEYVPPVTTVSLATVLKPLTLNVPPVLFLNTAVPAV
jgi:hypothetical protein